MDYLKDKVVCVLVIKSLEALIDKITALINDGYEVFEVTLRTDYGLEAIRLIKEAFPELKVGAGTVLNSQQLEASIKAGADFGVAPGLNKDLVIDAKKRGFDFIPGVATPTEIDAALSLGLKLVKLFPAANLGGPDYIKAISGPYPDIKLMPTGGVKEANYQDYLALDSVYCVGGSWMG